MPREPRRRRDRARLPPIVHGRSRALYDVPREALRALTELLYMGPTVDLAHPCEEWLLIQAKLVRHLHASLLRPASLLARVAISAGRHGIPRLPGGAVLCPTHRPLDPRVVRNLLLLVADEFTLRADKFRLWRDTGAGLPFSVREWLRRMDEATALWVGKDAFEKAFGRTVAVSPDRTAYSSCEACILSRLGGRPQALADLRSCAIMRQIGTGKPRDQAPEPRLLHILNSWISWNDRTSAQQIRLASETILIDLQTVKKEINEQVEASNRLRAARGKRPHRRRRPYDLLTPTGLPTPRPPSRHTLHQSKSESPEPNPPSPPEYQPGEYNFEKEEIASSQALPEQQQWVGTIDYGAEYIDAVEDIRHRIDTDQSRLSVQDVLSMSGAIGGAFSSFEEFHNFDNASAVPEPLHVTMAHQSLRNEGAVAVDESDARGWKSESVRSQDSWDQDPFDRVLVDCGSSATTPASATTRRPPAPPSANLERRVIPDSPPPVRLPAPAASSIYSAHPGPPRDQSAVPSARRRRRRQRSAAPSQERPPQSRTVGRI